MKQKILIDTDPGQDIDDLLAIWFALLRPELDVRAITTVTYPSDQRARLIKRLLRYLNRADVSVAAGMNLPSRELPAKEREWLENLDNSMNHRAFAEPHDPRDAADNADAIDLITRTVEENPGEVILCCIAPLTNVAAALQRKPEIGPKIKAIALMGGEVVQHRAEHNIAFDYIASKVVFASGVPIAMGTWSITRQFTLSMNEDCARFHNHSELGAAIADAIKVWHPSQSWKPGPVMYDIFPMIWAFDRSFYTMQPMSIQIETQGEHTCGWTIAGGDRRNIEVTTAIRAEAVRELFLSTVLV